VKLDKKADPRKRTFGSKITGREKPETKYYSVKRVEEPDCLELDDGTRVRLLGVRPKKGRAKEAVAFLRAATKGQKVFLRFDEAAPQDSNGACVAYVYLKNKTFLNAHLVKKRLAVPDTSLEHRFKCQFMEYAV
jgi:site-specific DNA-methyltransferase (adenine-specific)